MTALVASINMPAQSRSTAMLESKHGSVLLHRQFMLTPVLLSEQRKYFSHPGNRSMKRFHDLLD